MDKATQRRPTMFTVKVQSQYGFSRSKTFLFFKDAFRFYNANKGKGFNLVLTGENGTLLEGSKTFFAVVSRASDPSHI
jgi:hypothetical protein